MAVADITTEQYGFAVRFVPETAAGRAWVAQRLYAGEWQRDASGAVLADHRYAADLILYALDYGLSVQDAATGRFAHYPADSA